MQGIIEWLDRNGYGTIDKSFYSAINEWVEWYKGKTPFHSYYCYNGVERVRQTRKTLNMSKKISEDWANLLMNEKVEIVTGDEASQNRLNDILDANCFYVRANQLIELTMAHGTGAFVEFMNGDRPNID